MVDSINVGKNKQYHAPCTHKMLFLTLLGCLDCKCKVPEGTKN